MPSVSSVASNAIAKSDVMAGTIIFFDGVFMVSLRMLHPMLLPTRDIKDAQRLRGGDSNDVEQRQTIQRISCRMIIIFPSHARHALILFASLIVIKVANGEIVFR